MHVREYQKSDAERILSVHEAAFRASGIEFVPEAAVDEELRDVTESYLDSGGTFLVGVVDGEIVATGGYRPRVDEVAEVGHLRVHPDHQRCGHATTLMDAIEGRAMDEGFAALALWTHEALVAAQALYEGRGYEERARTAHPATGDEMIHYRKNF
ncbi:GNAT family N-acetyltransferase [Halomicrobium zhouii]|uniref:GNAT family N-acetyltransferase n=1 Tax=Halomicrobium zhouii TaxID=767519 RepID=UPI0015A6910C|nr:GNAT family N-acetyltransferase [Halomicrobium zhouii]